MFIGARHVWEGLVDGTYVAGYGWRIEWRRYADFWYVAIAIIVTRTVFGVVSDIIVEYTDVG